MNIGTAFWLLSNVLCNSILATLKAELYQFLTGWLISATLCYSIKGQISTSYLSPTHNSHGHLNHIWFWDTTHFGQYLYEVFNSQIKRCNVSKFIILYWPLHTTAWRAMLFWKTPFPFPRVRKGYRCCFRQSAILLFGCKAYDLASAPSTMTVACFWAQDKAFKHFFYVYEPWLNRESYLVVLYRLKKGAVVPAIYK